jgi:AraC-like DNA-binding protein
MNEVPIEIVSNFQFTAICFMAFFTLLLCLLPIRQGGMGDEVNRSRWLLTGGTGVLVLQFLLQYTLQLRTLGESQPLQLNLLMFMPASWLMSLAILVLQRQGRLSRVEWLAGGVAWAVVVALMVAVSVGEGQPFFCDTPLIRLVEKVGAGLYFASLCYYTYMELKELRRMQHSLDNFYDRDTDGRLRWMKRSIWALAAMALLVPVAIVVQGKAMFVFGVFLLGSIGYLVISFRDYIISKNAYKVMAAQQNTQESGGDMGNDEQNAPTIGDNERQRMDSAVEQWIATKRYLQNNIYADAVCQEMGVTQKQLRDWFPTAGYKSYADWMQHLRIEHAKGIMHKHPDYTIEFIAKKSGFTSDKYFYPVFKKITGMTPLQFLDQLTDKA